MPGVIVSLDFINISSTTKGDLIIKNLVFNNFNTAIRFRNFRNLDVIECSFNSSSNFGLNTDYSISPFTGETPGQSLHHNLNIQHNSFDNCEKSIYVELDEPGNINVSPENYENDTVRIDHNVISNTTKGITINSHLKECICKVLYTPKYDI